MEKHEEDDHLATLRPSMIRRVQAGALSWTSVDLLDLGGSNAAALRGVLEVFGAQITYLPIGQPRHLVAALGSDRVVAPIVILDAHGDDGEIVLDELDESVARFQPFTGNLGPDHIRRYLRLPGSAVIVTACDGGNEALAAAFLEAGASAYVADTHAPFSYASVFVPIFIMYELTSGRTLEHAVQRLQAHDEELATWRLFR